MPPGYVGFSEIVGHIFQNGRSQAPWGISYPYAAEEYFSHDGQLAFQECSPAHEFYTQISDRADALFGLLGRALIKGTLTAVALIPESHELVKISPTVWLSSQRPSDAPFDDVGGNLDLARRGTPIQLYRFSEHPPLAIVMIAESDLACFLGAKAPPLSPRERPIEWNDWLAEQRRVYATSCPARKQSTRQRGRRPEYNWRPMWIELVRRAMGRHLIGISRSELAAEMQEWWAIRHADDVPDLSSIDDQISGLFTPE